MNLTKTEFATFAAGCFWGVEQTFRKIPGVLDTAVGYSGGHLENPSYEQVCGGQTGHAEVVHLEFDPEQLSYDALLDTFWSCHDPTTPNRQGPDRGTQYRSAVFVHSDLQRSLIEAALERENKSGRHIAPIVTEIAPFSKFYRAEEYHQRYLEKNGSARCGS